MLSVLIRPYTSGAPNPTRRRARIRRCAQYSQLASGHSARCSKGETDERRLPEVHSPGRACTLRGVSQSSFWQSSEVRMLCGHGSLRQYPVDSVLRT